MDTRSIGMFDSGVGGITVLSEIIKELPNESIVYVGDTKRFPYGSKSKQIIIELSKKCVEYLIQKNVKVIIIACGTATSQALEELQNQFNIPIIGIIQPTISTIKKDIKQEKNRVGIIATNGTIKSNAWEIELRKQIKDIDVINKKCPLLAPMAEEGWINNDVAKYAIKEYMKGLESVNKLILGCTHYPLFKELIKKELGENVEIINTGEKIAKYLKVMLEQSQLQNNEKEAKYSIKLTDTECNFISVAKELLKNSSIQYEIEKINLYELEV